MVDSSEFLKVLVLGLLYSLKVLSTLKNFCLCVLFMCVLSGGIYHVTNQS